jgi:hypothetical protein
MHYHQVGAVPLDGGDEGGGLAHAIRKKQAGGGDANRNGKGTSADLSIPGK